MKRLFQKETDLNLPDSNILYYPNFLDPEKADFYFERLRKKVPWQQDDIKVFGKTYAQPRLTALYGINGMSYSYSNITMNPHPFTEELFDIKKLIETKCNVEFTSCLLNLYRDGRDSNGWHADNEKELGRNPEIASVTLGHARFFHLKHRTKKDQKHKLLLEHGSLLLMRGATQHNWLHQIPKTARAVGERINLTFRSIA